MEIEFTIPVESFSINNVHKINHKTKSVYYSPEYVKWRSKIFNQLVRQDIRDKLVSLKLAFDKYKHCLEYTVKVIVPHKQFRTESRDISIRSKDCSNTEKPLIDLLFDKRFCGRIEKISKLQIQNLEMDDKMITDLHSYKRGGESWEVQVKIKILEIDQLD